MKQILVGLIFLHNVLVGEPDVMDDAMVEVEVGQEESNQLHSSVHHLHSPITNKCLASKTVTSSPSCEHPTSSLHSFDPHGDELSPRSGDVRSGLESIPPNHDMGLPYRDVDMEPQDHITPPAVGTLHVSTSPSGGLPYRHDMEFQDHTAPVGLGTPHVDTNPSSLHFRVSGMRLDVSPHNQLDSHVIYIRLEMDAHNANRPSPDIPPMKLGKTFLGLTYQAMFSFLIFHYQAAGDSSSQDHSPKPSPLLLQIAEVNLAVSFTASLIGIILRQAYPEKSAIIERVGSMSAAFGFFIMVSMLLASVSHWVGWICAIGAFLAFVIAFMKRKKD